MSQLINTLNQIESLIQKYNPDELERVKALPDLTPKQIEEKLSCLPYKVPVEIVDLYRWHHSGHKCFVHLLDIWQFFDLDEAISTALNWNKSNFLNMSAFPVFSVEDVIYWTVGNTEQQNLAPIWSNDESTFPPNPDAISLTVFFEEKIEQLGFK
jgi:hypothetical protein